MGGPEKRSHVAIENITTSTEDQTAAAGIDRSHKPTHVHTHVYTQLSKETMNPSKKEARSPGCDA